ncbi:LytTR family DNA-binding domain-containing protein [uncultured Psychroserpens sp.]|uniref:LytR/AlgR family response regulator transcription factor n=1 Tax=uncultured Psychroserpens sp. TaxID=255436 RepID=UPI0026031495|nr:LytTR family DNA-binding domain-containing protein [uncultured Psychroserpens sp.]
MIKAIIVDDESFVRDDIRKKLISKFNANIAIVGEAKSVKEGITLVNNMQPQLIFLDINLEDGLGFDILKSVTFKEFDVIFITGFDDQAIKAIKVGALDYILKPIDDNEFKEAVDKALANNEKKDLSQHFEVSNDYLLGKEKKRIILKTADSVYAVYEDDIYYCKSDGNYTTFYTANDERIVISKSIKKVEQLLSNDVFVRCHQSYLVNKTHVKKYAKQGYLLLNSQLKVPVSSRMKDTTLSKIF